MKNILEVLESEYETKMTEAIKILSEFGLIVHGVNAEPYCQSEFGPGYVIIGIDSLITSDVWENCEAINSESKR